MATSTIIQYLEKSQTTATGATVDVGESASNRQQVETFLTEGNILQHQWVQFDRFQSGVSRILVVRDGLTVFPQGNPLVFGVALETVSGTATSPQPVRVVVGGYAEAFVDGAVVAGDALVACASASGVADAFVPGTSATVCGAAFGPPVGIGIAPVFVYKQF